MMDGQTELAGKVGCKECDSAMIRDGAIVRCSNCAYREGVVTYADRLAKFRADQSNNVSNYWPAKPRKKRETKAQRVIRQLEQPRLDGIIDPSRPGYRETERRIATQVAQDAQRSRVEVQTTSRCRPCDRIYVMAHGKPTCPACGTVDDTADALTMLLEAFNPPDVPA